ncbi:MAG: hypothetical protein U0X93_08880 [Anaerolineales bacterium]
MQQFFTDYLATPQDCHNGIIEAIDGLPSDALDWVYGEDMNSISVLVFPTGSVALDRRHSGAESSNRDRDAEFRVKGVGMDVLKKRLADNLEYARTALDKMIKIWKQLALTPAMEMNSVLDGRCSALTRHQSRANSDHASIVGAEGKKLLILPPTACPYQGFGL